MVTSLLPGRVTSAADLRRPPRYSTPRNTSLATRGGAIGVLAAEIGKPLLPHQQWIADVATELNPPGSRLKFRRQLVIVSLPRQTGKTTLLRPVTLDRALTTPRLQCFMTAQMGKDASERWNDLVADLEESPLLYSFCKVTRGKGSERASFPNSAFISPFAPGKKALHGYSPELVIVDEGWSFNSAEGADLLRAIRPAQLTKRDRQLWIVSAAGDESSEWWNELQEAGRESVSDPNSAIAYFDWSADPEADPYVPETWEFHPGLDGLITIEDLAEEARPENNSHGDWLRGFLNRSTKSTETSVLDLDQWDALQDEDLHAPEPAEVSLAYDVAIDRSSASIWGAWIDQAGNLCLHVIETRPGVEWLIPRLRDLYAAGLATIGADDGGPSRVITQDLLRENLPIVTAGGRDSALAWDSFKAAAEAGRLRHDGSPALREAIVSAAERYRGEAVVLSRRHSLGPIDPLLAAITAAWLSNRSSTSVPIY